MAATPVRLCGPNVCHQAPLRAAPNRSNKSTRPETIGATPLGVPISILPGQLFDATFAPTPCRIIQANESFGTGQRKHPRTGLLLIPTLAEFDSARDSRISL